jgi:hypothetical protein
MSSRRGAYLLKHRDFTFHMAVGSEQHFFCHTVTPRLALASQSTIQWVLELSHGSKTAVSIRLLVRIHMSRKNFKNIIINETYVSCRITLWTVIFQEVILNSPCKCLQRMVCLSKQQLQHSDDSATLICILEGSSFKGSRIRNILEEMRPYKPARDPGPNNFPHPVFNQPPTFSEAGCETF